MSTRFKLISTMSDLDNDELSNALVHLKDDAAQRKVVLGLVDKYLTESLPSLEQSLLYMFAGQCYALDDVPLKAFEYKCRFLDCRVKMLEEELYPTELCSALREIVEAFRTSDPYLTAIIDRHAEVIRMRISETPVRRILNEVMRGSEEAKAAISCI